MNAQAELLKRLEQIAVLFGTHNGPEMYKADWIEFAETIRKAITEIQRQDRHLGFIAELSEQAADGNPGDIPYTQDAIALSNYARTHRFEDE